MAVVAWRAGAASVAAVDLSARSVACTKLNARLNRVSIRALRGDMVAPVVGERFDLIVCNPAYVPPVSDALPRHSLGRCWDAGRDGRAVLDRFCEQVPSVLAPGGTVLVTHSDVTSEAETMDRLTVRGLDPCIEASITPFGPVMQARAGELVQRGLLDPGQANEQLVVVSARSSNKVDAR